MMIFERDIAIDLGTTNIRVFVRGKGIMLREPSIVAVDKYTGRMLKVGQDAQKMLGRTPANIVAIHPISAGVISDYDMTALMLKELLSRVTSFSLFKPRVLVTVPSSVTGVEVLFLHQLSKKLDLQEYLQLHPYNIILYFDLSCN